jgi:hypothetical protein
MSEKARFKFVGDMFNVFNEQKLVRVNQDGEQNGSPGTPNPDFLKPDAQNFNLNRGPYQNPFSARLGIRLEF